MKLQSLKLSKPVQVALLVLVLFGVLIALAVVYKDDDKTKQSTTQTQDHSHDEHKKSTSVTGDGTLALSPSGGTYKAGQTISLTVNLDTKGEKVNAAQADLTYPKDLLQYVSVEDKGSAFSIKAESSGGNGKVTIARGNIKPVSGVIKLATVKFKVLKKPGKATVAVADTSVLLRSSNSTNILSESTGASFIIK